MENKPISEDNSKMITSLRFILTSLVIIFHTEITDSASTEIPKYVSFFQDFIQASFRNAIVPLFFFFSGYLFFHKETPYIETLKKKGKSLLIPYLLWPLLNVGVFYLLSILPFANGLFTSKTRYADFGLIKYIDMLFGFSNYAMPYIAQFWYIQELIIVFIFSPLLKIALRKKPALFLFVAFAFWFTKIDFSLIIHRLGTTILFFSLGHPYVSDKIFDYVRNIAHQSRNNTNLKFNNTIITNITTLAFFGIVYIVALNKGKSYFFPVLDNFIIILSCIFFLRISAIIIQKEKLFIKLKWLSEYSFWMYAIHIPLLLVFTKKICTAIIPAHGNWHFILFISIALGQIVLSLLTGIICKKICPPLFNILTGGRIIKQN